MSSLDIGVFRLAVHLTAVARRCCARQKAVVAQELEPFVGFFLQGPISSQHAIGPLTERNRTDEQLSDGLRPSDEVRVVGSF